MRQLISEDPFLQISGNIPWVHRGVWPAHWVACPGCEEPPFVSAYRLKFKMDAPIQARVHVTADERYELFLDGKREGRGSERGDRLNWFFETYLLDLAAGEHTLVARVWSLGSQAPYAQMTVQPAFLLAAEGDLHEKLSTGAAPWEAKKLGGYTFVNPSPAWGTGAKLDVNGAEFCWGFERGEGDGWTAVKKLYQGANGFRRNEVPPIHMMKPSTLPAMLEDPVRPGRVRHVDEPEAVKPVMEAVTQARNIAAEVDGWQGIIAGKALTIPAHTRRRAIIDLDNYYCAFPELVTSGGKGSMVRVLWAESLYLDTKSDHKGNRGEIEGKFYRGVGDTFRPDGAKDRMFDTLWWEAGRYLEVTVETADEPLTIESLSLRETHYPEQMQSVFHSDDKRIDDVIPIAFRGLQMCSHETFMDCPYFEQLMYVGDTRLETLTTYICTQDDRLPRKALRMFNASRLNEGLTQSRYPSRVRQVIPPFSLWWVAMLHDFALWRNDKALVRSLAPGARAVTDCFRSFINADGLVEAPNGWNFMDWVPGWPGGMPAQADLGVSGIINWQFALVLQLQAKVEEWLGEVELAVRARKTASEIAQKLTAVFWDEKRGLYADDKQHTSFSEHAQCLAVLSGLLSKERRQKIRKGLLSAQDLHRTTIYFTHYLFETYRELGLMDELFKRMDIWFNLKQLGFKTTLEEPEPSRSDCHAWAAHPVYHLFASVLGIRPAAMGFQSVRIQPQMGPLTRAEGHLAHPKGFIDMDVTKTVAGLRGHVTLPEGVTGVLVTEKSETALHPGTQEF